ncbi:MAG: bifunctional adenosylcobinamide kinase/adenosylcobinamide-phosphate guanylyltransferase [Thermodesulfobacteria bacterium]|nr:bifunctional adenosylcobinamide kinase/adenosylcobinamide-phosphate guanylyltransferase [Thermodesulfobacteriota bacterium]
MEEKTKPLTSKIFVLGGIKSGKSRFALKLAEKFPAPRLFVATAEAFDEEMARKIKAHQRERDESWQTIEAPVELPEALRDLPKKAGVCLIDCLTVWLGNLWYYQKDAHSYVEKFLGGLAEAKIPIIVVSNEIGFAPLPGERVSRDFAEKLGILNQRVAALCDEVYLLVAGCPLKLK